MEKENRPLEFPQNLEDSFEERPQTKIDIAYNRLKHEILKNSFPSGMIMVERRLGEAMNLSRSPVREALSRLCKECILEKTEDNAIIVPWIMAQEAEELFELFAVLTDYSLRRCIASEDEAFRKDFLTAFRKAVERLEEASRGEDRYYTVWQDYNIYATITRFAFFRRIEPLVFYIMGQRIRIMMMLTEQDQTMFEIGLEHYKRILQCVEQREDNKAVNELKSYTRYAAGLCRTILPREEEKTLSLPGEFPILNYNLTSYSRLLAEDQPSYEG